MVIKGRLKIRNQSVETLVILLLDVFQNIVTGLENKQNKMYKKKNNSLDLKRDLIEPFLNWTTLL